jgi:hypothetical protein
MEWVQEAYVPSGARESHNDFRGHGCQAIVPRCTESCVQPELAADHISVRPLPLEGPS